MHRTHEELCRGDSGESVIHLQNLLSLEPSGSFDEETEVSLQEFQLAAGLLADGVAGPATYSHLHPALQRGASVPRVKEIQYHLQVSPDGYFGPKTEEAVYDFQQEHCLEPDGVVGPETYQCMF